MFHKRDIVVIKEYGWNIERNNDFKSIRLDVFLFSLQKIEILSGLTSVYELW